MQVSTAALAEMCLSEHLSLKNWIKYTRMLVALIKLLGSLSWLNTLSFFAVLLQKKKIEKLIDNLCMFS